MAGRVDIRELENRASEIVRDVHERETEFIVTFRGEPMAVLRPLENKGERVTLRPSEAGLEETLEEAARLAERIARAWRSPQGALELLEEQRR